MPVSRTRRKPQRAGCATHRPAQRKRHYRHDTPTALDLFSGFGGLTKAIRRAGFDVIMAANHNSYKVEIHEANHQDVEHWIADLVDNEAPDYHDVRDLPYADLLCAGISCTSHSGANTQKAYAQGLTLFDLPRDEEYEARVTRSERDRATASCVLHYAQKHHPRAILVECTTELQSWGPALQDRPKVGDGSTFRWWMRMLKNLNYKHKILYLNSMFFGVSQSRDRIYIVFWDATVPDPDLDHRPASWCARCDTTVEAVWSWKTGVPANGTVRYGQQYNYRCPSCRSEVFPPMAPSINALDLTNLGTRIGDKPLKTYKDGFVGPMAANTMGRAERCVRRFPEFPPILMNGDVLPDGHPWQQDGAGNLIQSTGAIMVGAGNTFERPGSDCRSRGTDQPMWSQVATNTTGIVTPPVALTGAVIAAHRHNGDGQHISAPMDTITSTHEKAMVIAVNNFQGVPRGVNEPFPTQPGSETLSLVSAGVLPFRKHTRPTTHSEAMPTVTAEQVPGLVATRQLVTPSDSAYQDWVAMLGQLRVEDCYFRMLYDYEVGKACDFDTDFPGYGYKGTFKVWGTVQQKIDGYGNAVSESVGMWIGMRLRVALHGTLA